MFKKRCQKNSKCKKEVGCVKKKSFKMYRYLNTYVKKRYVPVNLFTEKAHTRE